ncbi:MAG TPA: HAD family hydrolase [Candidatus Eremiobacteraceae bacterium]|nr:HAD family hydrolase [Candidatus Eremiobacteraceae bacterium]
MAERTLRRAVFLDRDGTLNVDTGYVARPEDVQLIAQAAQGAKRLTDAGYALVIASNQSGIARGMITAAQADAVDARLLDLLRDHRVAVAAAYRCPHLPGGSVAEYAIECDCRKPKPGLLLRAARDLGLDLAASWTVGDSPRDVEAGLAAGTRAVLISPDGAEHNEGSTARATDLLEAARIIVEDS